MNALIILLVFVVQISLAGCDFNGIGKNLGLKKSKSPAANETKPTIVEDFELAKLILKRENKPITIKRDPFMPLIKPPGVAPAVARAKTPANGEDDSLASVEFLGVGRMDENVGALLRSPTARGLFFINDTFRGFTLMAINEKEVSLKKGETIYTLRRRNK